MNQLDHNTTKKCILIICHFNKRNGCTLNEVYSKLAKYLFTFPELSNLITELKENNKIYEEKIDGEEKYFLTKEGNLEIRSYSEKEFLGLLNLISSEYEIRYRVSNIEYGILCGALSLFFYFLNTQIFPNNGLFPIFTFFFLGGFLVFLTKVIFRMGLNIINSLFGTTYSIFNKKIELISWIMVITVIVGILFLWWKIYPENFQQNLFVIILTIILGITGIIFLKEKIFCFLQWIIEKIKQK